MHCLYLFANVNFTHVRTQKSRDTGNQPLLSTLTLKVRFFSIVRYITGCTGVEFLSSVS